MSAAILQVSSSNALALKSETMVNDNINNSNNNNNNSIADYSSALKQQMQLLMGEKNNKLSASTNSSHASSALNMFQENDEEIINDNDMEESEEFDYDNYSYSETAEGLGIRLNNNDDDNIHLKELNSVDKKENGEEEFEEDDDEYGNVNEGENGHSNKSVNDRDDKINKDQDCGTLDDNNKNNEKSKKNQIPHFEYVSYDKVQDLYEQRKGHFYFIPEGFEPVLVPNDTKAQTVTNLLESTKPVSAAPNVSRMLPDTDVRLPSYALPCGVNASSKKENANKTNSKPKKTPRPPNAFILYRRAKQPLIVAKNAGISNNDVSKEIGKMWHEESLEVRQKYQKLAEKAKEEHMKRFPEYKYRPRRPQDKKRHHSPQPIPVAAPVAAIVHDEKESEEGKMNNVEKKINNEALNINNNIDNSIHDLYYNDDESFYNNCHHQQQYQLLSVPSQQMFYQNQINSISPVDTFSLIGNTTDFISSDVDDNGNNNQFTTYLQNVNDLDFPLLQELQPNYDFDFNGYNL